MSLARLGRNLIAPPYHMGSDGAAGFTFHRAHPDAVTDAVRYASRVYASRTHWNQLAERGMAADFFWAAAAECYSRLYELLSEKKRRAS